MVILFGMIAEAVCRIESLRAMLCERPLSKAPVNPCCCCGW